MNTTSMVIANVIIECTADVLNNTGRFFSALRDFQYDEIKLSLLQMVCDNEDLQRLHNAIKNRDIVLQRQCVSIVRAKLERYEISDALMKDISSDIINAFNVVSMIDVFTKEASDDDYHNALMNLRKRKAYDALYYWASYLTERHNLVGVTHLGRCYALGYGVEINYIKAFNLFRKAAEQGNVLAQYNLGVCYSNGAGVEKNYEEAVKWYRKAAEQGNAPGMCGVGFCYHNGEGVEKDYEEAVKWYRKAAEQGDEQAQNYLGVCYRRGEGVEKDYEEAFKWFRKAAEQGDKRAQNNLGICYKEGVGVEKDYEEAVKWYRKAAEQGHTGAQRNLGICYKEGVGVEKDDREAVKWFRKADEHEDNYVIRK